MPGQSIFISHATPDGAFVTDLRQALEGLGHAVWVDSRALRDHATVIVIDNVESALPAGGGERLTVSGHRIPITVN
jgi:hypothetical protein